jgi:holdfast attachment protein HfaA
MTRRSPRSFTVIGTALLAVAAASTASAQSMNAQSAGFNHGYGRTPGQESRGFEPGALGRDANGNRVIIDGVIQTGADQSSFSRSGAYGAADSYSGAGAVGGATAIGNNLTVVTQGSYNTVIVDSTQINNGNVIANAQASSASGDLNGTIDIHDPD